MARLVLPLLLLVAAIFLAFYSDRPTPRADFTFINRGDVTTLDLAQMSWTQDLRVARLLYEGLVRIDVFTHEFRIIPGLAERWDVSPDGLTYTFHIRSDARWSNGSPCLPSDVVYSWRRVFLPELGADYNAMMFCIRGAEEFSRWRLEATAAFGADRSIGDRAAAARALWEETIDRFDRTVGLRADDTAGTLTVELHLPTPYFLELCAFPVFCPLYPPLLRAHESIDPRTGQLKWDPEWTKPPRLVTNGPFILKHWRFKRDMWLEKSPNYWRRDGVVIDTISIPSIDDHNAQVLAFRTGAIDWVSDVTVPYRAEMLAEKAAFYGEHREQYEAMLAQGLDPIEIDARLPADPRNRIHAFPAFGTYFYSFNCLERLHDGRANPFSDPRIRRAFTMAVDRSTITELVRRSGEPIAAVLIPPGSIDGYESPDGLGHDPDEARRLLAECGYPGGRGFPLTVEVLFNKEGGHDLIAQSVARDWQRELGIDVRLEQVEIKVFRDRLKSANYQIARGSWYGDYGDPTTFLNLNRTGDGNNDRKYSNPDYDAILDLAEREIDPARRMALLREAERIVVEVDLPLLTVFHYLDYRLFDPHRITGISSHTRSTQTLYRVDVLGDGKGPDRLLVLPPRQGAWGRPPNRSEGEQPVPGAPTAPSAPG